MWGGSGDDAPQARGNHRSLGIKTELRKFFKKVKSRPIIQKELKVLEYVFLGLWAIGGENQCSISFSAETEPGDRAHKLVTQVNKNSLRTSGKSYRCRPARHDAIVGEEIVNCVMKNEATYPLEETIMASVRSELIDELKRNYRNVFCEIFMLLRARSTKSFHYLNFIGLGIVGVGCTQMEFGDWSSWSSIYQCRQTRKNGRKKKRNESVFQTANFK